MKITALKSRKSIAGLFYNFLVILIAAILLFGSLSVALFIYRTEQSAWQERQTDVAKSLSFSINQIINQNQSQMEWILSFAFDPENGSPKNIDDIFARFPDLNEIYYQNDDGTQYRYYNDELNLIPDVIQHEYPVWYRSATTSKITTSDLDFLSNGKPYLIFCTKLSIKDFLAIRVNASDIVNLLRNADFSTSGKIYLINHSGEILVDSSGGASQNDIPVNQNIYQSAFQSHSDIWYGEYLNYEGSSVAGASAPIANTDWVIMTEVPTALVYRSSMGTMILLVFLIIILGLIFIGLQAGRIQRMFVLPIKDLRNGAASIGQGNFNLVLPPYEVAELEELRGSLNAMALQLKDRENTLLEQQALLNDEVSNRARMEAKLRELNEMLEEKVLERTRQLSQTNEKLREEIQAKEHSQSQYQALVEQTLAVTYVSQFQPEFKIKFISPQIEKLIGWTPDQLIARPELFSACIHPDDLPRIRELIQEMHTDQHIYHIEYRIISRNGEMIWVQDDAMVLPQVAGEPQSVQGVIMNINVRKETEERMLYTAFHDPLTGLKNRTFLYKELETLIDNPSGLNDHSFALLHLDIDRFKVVNDSLGHRFGDRLLIAIADRLQTLLQPNTILARLSGDEFIILIKTISPESEATHLAERIIADLRNPFSLDGRIVYTSVSIGIAINNAEYLTPEDVMRDVDIAMYRAKSRGRGCYEHFTTPLRDQMINRHQIEEMLRTAIDAEEFEVHYQPIVHLLENRLVGFEALVRWNSPQHGMISPGQFLPIAEETGMIHAIDRWVMRTACQQLQTWHTTNMVAPDVSMSVNLSGSRLQQTGVIEMIADILAETRLNPALLKIEITESVFISTTDEMVSLLNQIRALGVQLQIDDFGTGYSSLSYLQRFPINAIKIDRSFISRIDGENSGTEIVQAIILLARELGMGTVAEGIETPAQFEWLRNANCQFGQGFLMYRPLDKETAGKLLASINA